MATFPSWYERNRNAALKRKKQDANALRKVAAGLERAKKVAAKNKKEQDAARLRAIAAQQQRDRAQAARSAEARHAHASNPVRQGQALNFAAIAESKKAALERAAEGLSRKQREAADLMTLANLQKFGARRVGEPGFMGSSLREADIAKRQGLSIAEARRRAAQARRQAAEMQARYRREGLYYGGMGGENDPLLSSAFQVKYAKDEAGERAAIDRYVKTDKKQSKVRVAALRKRAALAQTQLQRDLADAKIAAAIEMGGFDEETAQFLRDVQQIARTPKATSKDPERVIAAQQALERFIKDNEDNNPGGFAGVIKDVADAPGLGHVLRAAAVPMEELVMQPYYASTRARDQGGGLGRQLTSFGSSLPGLGFLAGGASARDRAATDSYAEREALGLKSFGQNIADALIPENMRVGPLKGLRGAVSGTFDLGLQVVGDPLNAATLGAAKVGRVGVAAGEAGATSVARSYGVGVLRASASNTDDLIEATTARIARAGALDAQERALARQAVEQEIQQAAQSARLRFIDQTKRGQRLTTAVEKVVDGSFDAAAVQKAVPGLDHRTASAMAAAQSKTEAIDIFKQAFATGRYSPSITLRRQLLGAWTDRAYAAPGGVLLGSRVARQKEGIFDIVAASRRKVRGTAIQSTSRVGTVRALQTRVVQSSLARAGLRLDDAYERISHNIVGLDPIERLDKAWAVIEGDAGLENLFENALRKVENDTLAKLGVDRKTATLADLDAVLADADVESFIKQMEVLAATKEGAFGAAAKKQASLDAKFGMERKPSSDDKLLKASLANVGLRDPRAVRLGMGSDKAQLKKIGLGLTPEQGRQYLKDRITFIDNPDARAAMLRIAETTPDKGLGKALARTEALVDRPAAADEFARLLRNQDELVGAVEEILPQAGLARRMVNAPVKFGAKFVNSVLEPVAPNRVAFLGYTNDAVAAKQRVEDVDRWVRDIGLDDFTRATIRSSVERVKSEDDLFRVVDEVLRLHAIREGIPEKLLLAIQKEGVAGVKTGSNRINFARVVDGVIRADSAVQTLAQRGELVYLPDPDDVRRAVRSYKAFAADNVGNFDKILAGTRVGLSKPLDWSIFGLKGPVTGEDITIRAFLTKVHRTWKYTTVVPGLQLAALGAGVGFVGTDGTFDEKLAGAAQAASIGLLSPLRYVVRVAGIEEGMRKYLAGGLNAEMWKVHLSRSATNGFLDRPFTQYNAVKAGDPIGLQHQRLLETVHAEWTTQARRGSPPVLRIFRKDQRFLDGYGRIVNNQIHPETDAVAEMFLRKQAGELTDAELVTEFKRFIEMDAGKLWLRRMKGAAEGPKNADEAFERYRDFISTHVADEDVARARLDAARTYAETGRKADVPVAVLKAAQRRGALPEVIHLENTFRVPRNFKEVALMRDRLTSKFAFEGPTTAINRIPMAKAIYRDEYIRLRRDGVPGAQAQEIAEETAIAETNRIMFRIDDESRFAAKSDYVFPFQQPREELLRVWVPLVAQNKVRALQMTRLAAVAFNNGQDKGIFTQDRYGEWRFTVPGSAYLSKLLFNSGSSFNATLSNLLFFGQGAYGVNVIPSPGGPYWAAASRMFLNSNPDWYEGLNPAVREWLAPYGVTGRIFRPEVSRMWQAWLGEPAPFEFASRQEQENALNRHRIEITLQLIWQHAQKTGDWTYRPTEEEVDEATSASLKAWAFLGATFPSSPGIMRPDQAAFDAVKEQYINASGEFDFIRFQNEHPYFAPWMVGFNETKADTFDEWAKNWSPEQSRLNTTTHRQTIKPWSEWSKELKEREAESRAYKERGDIFHLPAHLQQDAYAAWDDKYPELAQGRMDTYQRDIELMHIEGSLVGIAKDEALNKWRQRYDVTFANYQRLAAKLRDGALRSDFDPWESARDQDDIVNEVKTRIRRTQYAGQGFKEEFANERRLVERLPVVEQIKYWQHRIEEARYVGGDPEESLSNYWALKTHLNSLWNTAPMKLDRAMKPKEPKPLYEAAIDGIEEDFRTTIKETQDQAFELDRQVKALAAKEQWGGTYDALKKRRQALFDLARELKNKWYQGIPDVQALVDEVKAVMVLKVKGREDYANEILKYRKEYGWFLPSGEEQTYRSMPAEVQESYIEDIVNDLNRPNFTKGKRFFSWLTDFQQDLLRKNLPAEQIAAWEAQVPAASGSKGSKNFKSNWVNYPRRKYGRYGAAGDNGELAYAYAMFEQYNQRGGMKAPPAYQEYLQLPNDAALRSAYLKRHPEVAHYISKGPMANMPPSIAMLVADIMIRAGKWEGESRTMTEISEIGFAKEMLARWNRRGERQPPAAMQAWTDMPTGPEKAQYLRDHPEIGEWMQLGPMANMPEAYREVVRDIMTRYGIWTAGQDPLGRVISGYYSTPSYARDKYLEQHPELVEYWKAIRDPEEAHLYDLSEQYFSLKDPMARRMFLAVNPTLQKWFLHKRQQRYENFLNQVAVYMGSNPELFTKYLDRQEDILSELLHKFSEAPMVREQYVLRGVRPEKKRQRDAA